MSKDSDNASAAQLAQVIRLAPVGMLVVDSSGRITMANPAVLALFGFDSAEELIGCQVEVMVPPEQHKEHEGLRANFERSATSHLMAGRPVAGRTRTGKSVPLEISLTALADSEGSTLAVLTDLRSRLAADDAVRSHNEALARHNDDLEHFARVVAHDLREPLRTIVGFAQLLEAEQKNDPRLSDEVMEYIQFVVSGAYRMQDLLDAMLRYARLNEPSMPVTINLNDCLQAALENLAALVNETKAEIVIGALPTVAADEEQMVIVLQNLISNAIKFRNDTPPKVEVRSTRSGDFWRIAVRDNGIGIEPQFQERAFDVFQRLNGDRFEGTGMGLAICRRIVQRLGGTIDIHTVSPVGTELAFTVPATEETLEQEAD